MDKPFHGLTPAKAERLYLLLEELGGAQQAIGKILRHGYESYHPDDPDKKSNREWLIKELGDILAAIEILSADINLSNINMCKREKLKRVVKYLHHQ